MAKKWKEQKAKESWWCIAASSYTRIESGRKTDYLNLHLLVCFQCDLTTVLGTQSNLAFDNEKVRCRNWRRDLHEVVYAIGIPLDNRDSCPIPIINVLAVVRRIRLSQSYL